MEQRPRMKPIPWAAPTGPQISKAMGPNMVMKQPSKNPMTSDKKTIRLKAWQPAPAVEWALIVELPPSAEMPPSVALALAVELGAASLQSPR